MFFGSILIITGLVFLLKNLGIITINVWPVLWPLILMAIGFSFIFKKKKRNEKWHKIGDEIRERFAEESENL